jgi:aryl-alcohol dehydrogenase-like predicted oxidoreductase
VEDERSGNEIVHYAVESGINWIDVAAVYGLGYAEGIVGRAVQDMADPPFIFTKCGYEWSLTDPPYTTLKREAIRSSVTASLGRTGLEVLDLCFIHWPIPDIDLEEGWCALAELKEEGKVRHVGLSNCSLSQLRRCETFASVEAVEIPYSLAQPEAAQELMPYCGRHGIGVVIYAPQATGLLSGAMTRESIAELPAWDDRAETSPFQEPALTRNLGIAAELSGIARGIGVTPGELAIAWVLANDSVSGAIVGCERREHVDHAIASLVDHELLRDALLEAGLLSQGGH